MNWKIRGQIFCLLDKVKHQTKIWNLWPFESLYTNVSNFKPLLLFSVQPPLSLYLFPPTLHPNHPFGASRFNSKMTGLVMVTKGGGGSAKKAKTGPSPTQEEQNQLSLVAALLSALRKSMASCSVDEGGDDGSAAVHHMEIGWPTNVRHITHVTFDRFHGFLGLPVEFEVEVPCRAPSARYSVNFSSTFAWFIEKIETFHSLSSSKLEKFPILTLGSILNCLIVQFLFLIPFHGQIAEWNSSSYFSVGWIWDLAACNSKILSCLSLSCNWDGLFLGFIRLVLKNWAVTLPLASFSRKNISWRSNDPF